MAGSPASKESTSWSARNWCFVKVYTDEGITGLGEGSGWPRVVETAINDLKPIVIGEDPMNIERIWQKILVSTMGALRGAQLGTRILEGGGIKPRVVTDTPAQGSRI